MANNTTHIIARTKGIRDATNGYPNRAGKFYKSSDAQLHYTLGYNSVKQAVYAVTTPRPIMEAGKRTYLAPAAFLHVKARAMARSMTHGEASVWANRVTERYLRLYGLLDWVGK